MAKGMNVLVVAPFYPREKHPYAGIYIHQQYKQIAGRLPGEHRVMAFRRYLPRWMGIFANRLRADVNARNHYTWDGIAVESVAIKTLPKNMTLEWSRVQMEEAIRRAVKRAKPDVIHAHLAYPTGLAACRIAKEAGTPCVVTVHGWDINRVPVLRAKYRERVQECLLSADMVLAVSRALYDSVIRLAPAARARVAYIGTDIDRGARNPAHAPRDPRCLQIVFVGNLVRNKGVHVLLDAFLGFDRGVLTFVGDGPERNALEKRARKFGATERVRFLGRCPHDVTMRWIAASDLLVLPSFIEGLGMVLVEAAVCGTPVVASRTGGIPEVVQDKVTGLLVPPGDADALRQAISWVADHPTDACTLAANAQAHVMERFDIGKNVDALIADYRRVCACA